MIDTALPTEIAERTCEHCDLPMSLVVDVPRMWVCPNWHMYFVTLRELDEEDARLKRRYFSREGERANEI
ncbi:MAG: hypothetical protein L0226_15105 [Acidobacteria bacterium]|nr:hypothetical protein [Acidobacteriota bacterium]MCI0661996.1 hypothetical protein [Acidobacteriota bacterium]